MKKIGIIFVALFLLMGVSFVLGAVVINEVEIDSSLGEEWVELYNGAGNINITGWKLWDGLSSASLKATIPDEIFLGPGSYYVVDVNGLNNNGDNVSLYDKDGVLIDFTSILSDEDDDNKTWQRIPDGTGSFGFFYDTKGSTNEDNIRDVPSEYATIQSAIDAANPGDIINVASGGSPYEEDLVIDATKENLEINATESGIVIKGVANVPIASWPLAVPNIEILADGVNIHGFTIESPDYVSGKYTSGIVFNGKNIEIYDNDFVINSAATLDEISQVMQSYSNLALPDSDISGLNVHDNTFTHKGAGTYGYEAIYINPDEETSKIYINDNIFSGNVLRAITSERSKVEIDGNSIITDLAIIPDDFSSAGAFQGINIRKFDGSSQVDVTINDNIIKGSDAGKGFNQAIRLGQTGQSFVDADVTNNIINFNKYGILAKVGNKGNINLNDFSDNTFGVENEGSNMDAEENWWGACDGPSDAGPGTGSPVSINVDYEPWIGVCIKNKFNDTCAFENKDAEISAEVIGEGILDVWFSYTIDGVNYNKTGISGSGNNYSYDIPESELVPGTVTWNVYVNDSYGREYSNGLMDFYVRDNTELVVNPVEADGLNDWYVSEPLFSLLGDGSLVSSYYKWGAEDYILYDFPFRLENIPNQPNTTAGTLKLSWLSEFVCGNESKNNQTFRIDLTNPIINELSPANGSLISNSMPEISAYLDEVYQSNSGINLTSVVMEVDGFDVPEIIVLADTLDARVSYTPITELSDGVHNVSVYAEDNAGRSSELIWSFEINKSMAEFDLDVVSPVTGNYDSRKVKFEITTDKEVEIIEYINNNDRRPRWRRLCKNCDEFGVNRARTKNMKEGENNITIRAVDNLGNTEEVEAMIFVDSKKPRISKILPKRRSFTNGSDFYVKYTEDNLQEILFSFNLDYVVTTCSESGRNIECYFDYDLSPYDGDVIEYFITLTDLVRSVESKKVEVTVDMSAPEILNPDSFWSQGEDRKNRYIYFDLEINEDNLDEVNYIDYEYSRPRWRRLCSRLKDGHCEKRKSFKKGLHNVDIQVLDEAGNSAVVSVGEFSVV